MPFCWIRDIRSVICRNSAKQNFLIVIFSLSHWKLFSCSFEKKHKTSKVNLTLQHMHFPFAPKKVEKCNLCTGVAVVLTTIDGLFKFSPKNGQILIHMSRNIWANIGKFGHSLSSGNCLHHIVSQIWNLRFRGLLHKIDFSTAGHFFAISTLQVASWLTRSDNQFRI